MGVISSHSQIIQTKVKIRMNIQKVFLQKLWQNLMMFFKCHSQVSQNDENDKSLIHHQVSGSLYQLIEPLLWLGITGGDSSFTPSRGTTSSFKYLFLYHITIKVHLSFFTKYTRNLDLLVSFHLHQCPCVLVQVRGPHI